MGVIWEALSINQAGVDRSFSLPRSLALYQGFDNLSDP